MGKLANNVAGVDDDGDNDDDDDDDDVDDDGLGKQEWVFLTLFYDQA